MCGHAGAHEEEGPAQVDLPDEVEVAGLDGLDGPGDEDGGVVHEDVDAAPLLDDAVDAGGDAVGVAHVHAHGQRLAAVRADGLGDGVDGAGEALVADLLGASGDGDLRTGGGEGDGDVLADAAAGPGDDGDTAVERSHGDLPESGAIVRERGVRRAG